jgi:TPR repeat protein
VAAALLALAGAAAAQQPEASPPGRAVSRPAALERGLDAYQAGRQEVAIAALSEAAGQGDPTARFVAEFYLARVYAERVGAAADQTKAFVLYRKLADENLTVDPNTSQRAPFVAKALIVLAGYVRDGIAEIDLAPNPRRAADYLHHAAVFFGDRDAQFELARTYLSGDSPNDDVKRGLHYLAVLTEESHAPAQAMLADLFWHGRYVKKDDRRALALATMAVERAPAHERLWIEETYATVFCAAPQVTREEANRLVANWRRMFLLRAAGPAGRTGLDSVDLLAERQCASGERVAIAPAAADHPAKAAPADHDPGTEAAPAAKAASLSLAPAAASLPPLKGAAVLPSTGFRAAGILEATAKK